MQVHQKLYLCSSEFFLILIFVVILKCTVSTYNIYQNWVRKFLYTLVWFYSWCLSQLLLSWMLSNKKLTYHAWNFVQKKNLSHLSLSIFLFPGQQTLKKNSYQIVYVAKGMMTKTEREESKIIVGQGDMSPIWNKIWWQ